MRTVVFAPGHPSWVETDVQILSTFSDVKLIDVLQTSVTDVKAYLPLIARADVCYFWFGSFRHLPFLLLAKIFRAKVVIVAGGYDVNKLDSIGYGAGAQGFVSRLLRKLIFALADQVLAVSEFTRQSAIEHMGLAPETVKTVYLAFGGPQVALTPWEERAARVVFLISARDNMFQVKGIDRIPELCTALPHVQFSLAGQLSETVEAFLKGKNLANLELIGFLPFQSSRFIDLLNSSRVVCLPSRMESFGAAMIDGAIFGCVPVSLSVGALPEVVSGFGETVSDSAALATAIERVITGTGRDVEQIRMAALNRFPIERRKVALEALFAKLGAERVHVV
jgi:glycosyltransferase involved in cell wall biosynthesis